MTSSLLGSKKEMDEMLADLEIEEGCVSDSDTESNKDGAAEEDGVVEEDAGDKGSLCTNNKGI